MNTESLFYAGIPGADTQRRPDNLVIHNPDSNILQLYELNTPFMIPAGNLPMKRIISFPYIRSLLGIPIPPNQPIPSTKPFLSKRPLPSIPVMKSCLCFSGSITNHVENQTFTYGPGQCCVMNKKYQALRDCPPLAGDFQVVFFS